MITTWYYFYAKLIAYPIARIELYHIYYMYDAKIKYIGMQ